MLESNACRLCGSTENHPYWNLFGELEIELKLYEIISEHFKCDISEDDSLPKNVCQMCWSTTESFHELYQKSKLIQAKFLNQAIKMEIDATESYQREDEAVFCEEQPLDIMDIKMEPEQSGEDIFGSDVQSAIHDEFSLNSQRKNKTPTSTEKRKVGRLRKDVDFPMNKQLKDIELAELFSKNKHLFDMSCDNCTVSFENLADARKHYADEHEHPNGYIKCCTCTNVKLSYVSSVKTHMNYHLERDKYKCTRCGKSCGTAKTFELHMNKHKAADLGKVHETCFVCDICKQGFTSKSNLMKHLHGHVTEKMQLDSEEETYRKFMLEHFDMSCDHCSTIFVSVFDARRHYREFHNIERGYIRCCNTRYFTKPTVNGHIAAHLNPDHYKCELCGKKFMAEKYLLKHRKNHINKVERKFICDICGKTFPVKASIKTHILSVHLKSEPKFECDICHKGFQLGSLHRAHMKQCHSERRVLFTCEICGKSFKKKERFKIHVAVEHTNQKIGKECEHCGEWLSTPGKISYHKNQHKSGPQTCQHCQKEYPNKLSLQTHILSKHGQLKHKCNYCDRSFSLNKQLKDHEESHTRHKLYPCKFCSKVFNVYKSLDTHRRRHHLEEHKMSKNDKNYQINSG